MPLPANLEGLSAEQIAQLATAGQALFNNPATRSDAQRLVKKIDPSVNFPELDLEDRLAKQREEFNAELAKRDKEQSDRLSAERRERDLKSLTGLLPDEVIAINPEKKMAPIEEFMVRNKIGDYATAARLYKAEQAPAPSHFDPFAPSAPVSPSLPNINLEGKNLTQWSREQAYQTFGDLRSGKLKVDERGVPIQ